MTMDDTRQESNVEVAGHKRRAGLSPDWYRMAPPTACPDCGEPAARDSHFCWSCRTFLRDRWVGKLASAKRRLGAAMLDGTFKDGSALALLFWNTILPGAGPRIIAIMSGIYWIGSLFLWAKGTTPGKRLLRMRVITMDGEPAGFFRMAFRETIGKAISTMVFGLGLLSIPFDKEKRGWHDKMAGTWVVLEDES